MAFDEMRARDYAQRNLMTGEDLLRIGNYANLKGYGKVYLILTTHRLLLVGKKAMLDLMLKDVMNVGWKKKSLVIQTANSHLELGGKSKWRRNYDDFLRTVREQQLGFGVGRPAHVPAPAPPVIQPIVVTPPTQSVTREVTTRERVMVRCRYCGNLVEQGVAFCVSCGARL